MHQLPCRLLQCSILKGALSTTNSRSYGTIQTRNNSGASKLLRAPGNRHVTMVSTTRGVPSTSNDLKEALCEKIPLHYDLVRKFRSQYGSSVISEITVDDLYNGLKDISTVVRETSEVDPQHGVRYRGLTIAEVLGLLPRHGIAPSPEAVFWLLLTGDVPTQQQTASLVADWNSRRQRRRNWWFNSGDGSFIGGVIRTLPKDVTPLGKLSIALTTLGTREKNSKESIRASVMNYTHWEHTYEEGMELLAILPAIVGLVRKTGEDIKGNMKEDGDWVDFFLDCSGSVSDTIDGGRKASLADFLRLYIATNADEDGGTPAAHVAEIMGATRMELSKALASSALAYSNEPATGSMLQCMEFQLQIRSALGREPNEEALKDFVSTFFERDNEVTGYKECAACDPRYTVLSEFTREHLPEDPEIKLSKEISRILASMAQSTSKRIIWPEQNTLAAPIFRFYGLKDMDFNQALLCMSRALGAVASIIWNTAVDIPVEQPRSRCTYTYVDSFQNARKSKIKRVNYKHLKGSRK